MALGLTLNSARHGCYVGVSGCKKTQVPVNFDSIALKKTALNLPRSWDRAERQGSSQLLSHTLDCQKVLPAMNLFMAELKRIWRGKHGKFI